MSIKSHADNDELGNAAAHFFKSGSVTRSSANDALEQVTALLPEEGNFGTNLEYDLWYSFNDSIHGYVYTDVMTKFVYIKPASKKYANQIMRIATTETITEEGQYILEDIANNNSDKYNLKKARKSYDFVIFLPGTNCINDVIDFGKITNAVRQGAKLKMHPLTSKGLETKLKNDFGKETIIDKKIAGHQLLENAAIVGCGMNSEMGLVALSKGKKVYLFDKDDGKRNWTYTPIYKAIQTNNGLSQEKWLRILSSKYSGLVPHMIENPKERIEHFFTYFKGTKHNVKNSNTRNK